MKHLGTRQSLCKWNQHVKRGISLLLAFFAVCSCLCVNAPIAYASGTTLKVGYSDPNGIFADENGIPTGYAVEYLEEFSKYSGWKFDLIPYTWEECLAALERGTIDLMVMTRYTPERGERFLFSDLPMGYNHAVIFTEPDSQIYYQDYQAFRGCRIGVTEGTVVESSVIKHSEDLDLNWEIVPFLSEKDMRQALARGEIDLMAGGASSSYPDLKIVDRCGMSPSYIITNRQNQDLMKQINIIMQQIAIEDPSLQTRLSEKYQNTVSVDLHLTREEQEYIDSSAPIDIHMFGSRRPVAYYEGDQVKGILPDYMDVIGELTGLTFNYLQAQTASHLTEAASLQNGGLLISSDPTIAETYGLVQSASVLQLEMAYIRHFQEADELHPNSFAILSSMPYLTDLFADTDTVVTYDTVEECLDAVVRGEVDMTVQYKLIATNQLQKPKYAANLMEWVGKDYNINVYLYGGEEYATLFRILDKAQKYFTDAEKMNIVNSALMDHGYERKLEDLAFEHKWMVFPAVSGLIILALVQIIRRRKRHTDAKEQENKDLQLRLMTDSLTGLYSREGFFEKAQKMIEQETAELYIVRLNICNFKMINELRGIEMGDKLLCAVSDGLKSLSDQYGFLASRFSADLFYLCIRRTDFEEINFQGRVSSPWLGTDVTLTYGVYPVDKENSVSAMCDRASMAITDNHQMISEFIYYYDDEFRQRMIREQEIERDMEQALVERQFCIYIQPKFDIGTEQITGGEVLVRWLHPQKGMIPPYSFIGVFEKNGFILQLDYYVWEEACRFLAATQKSGLPHIPLSINISRLHFYSGKLQDQLSGLLEKYHLDAKDLELEITESIYAEDPEIILEQCAALQNLGFKIAMDDFGSGFSSLNMLKRMPLDIIKMDLKFLSDDANSEQAVKGHDILRTQIELAHTIGLDVVVEGLETREQKDFIREIGNCTAQGYYYAKPMPVSDFTELLRSANVGTDTLPMSGMAAALRRERLRHEQLQPLLESIIASDTLIGYLLPEKEAVLSRRWMKQTGMPQRVPNWADHFIDAGIVSPDSAAQFKALVQAAERGESTGSALVEFVTSQGSRDVHWIQFDTVMDFEGNPLIAMFNIIDFGDVSAQVDLLMASKRTQAEIENMRFKENEKILTAIAQHSDRAVCLYDINRHRSMVWSEEMCRRCTMPCLNKASKEEALENQAFPMESKAALRQMFDDIENGVASGSTKIKVLAEDGSAHWKDVMFSTMCDEHGKPVSALFSNRDVTEQYEHELAYLHLRETMSSNTLSNIISVESDLTEDRVERIGGLLLKEDDLSKANSHAELGRRVFDQTFAYVNVEEARAYFSRDGFLAAYDKGERHQQTEWQVRYHLDGSERWMDTEVTLMEDPYSKHIKMFLWMRDITDEKREQLEIRELSERDGMTGLYNRNTAEKLIREKLRQDNQGIFLVLDLDRLKQINDGYGHSEGDRAIISIAQALKAHFRNSDIIGRIGGDEFVVYLSGAARNKDVISKIISELLNRMDTLSVGEHAEMAITCSIGCAVGEKNSTYDSLYKQADKALYHVKKSGRNNFAFYSPEMEKDDYVYEMDKLFSLDHAKRYETGEVKQLLTTLSDIFHLIISFNITENTYHFMQEVKNGTFTQRPVSGNMDALIDVSTMRMPPEDSDRFKNAVSRQALIEAYARGENHVSVQFLSKDTDDTYRLAECNSILYLNTKGDLCEFALIRWVK